MYDMQGLWKLIENTVWGNEKCVEGSTTTTDRSFPSGAKNTVVYSSAAGSQLGLISGSSRKWGPLYSSANATTTVKSGYLAPTGSLTITSVTKSTSSSVNGGSGAKNTSSASTSMGTTATMASASSTSIRSAIITQFNGAVSCVQEAWWMVALTAAVGSLLAWESP
ncbi:hypothetical protein BOTCAL_0480g00060 [Botryotinia calthae]|uniref:Uncharacterized protein n=1 Tax=Botryotinia calthae TaxID=38488 RepID=A0A4Y8CMQ6_9HELO|nr:hypothetical protein BOTCAL_0480g00060 [Botryotinia calthae]